jgi:hypothetical protein
LLWYLALAEPRPDPDLVNEAQKAESRAVLPFNDMSRVSSL